MIMPLMTVSVHAGVWELHDPDWGTSYSTDPEYVYSGSRSEHLGFGDTSVNGWWTLSGTSASFGVEKHDSGKTYTLSFYFKCHEGTETNQYLEVAFGGQGWDGYVGQGWADSIVIEGNDFNAGTKEGIAAGGRFAKLELTDAGNGWKRLEYTPIVTEPGVNLFAVKAGTKTNMYIDDISIKDETGKELVKNGGFEIVGERVDYEPKNVLATAANANKMSISWRNPAAPALSKVSIYEVTGGKNELLSAALSTDADAICEYKHENATAGVHVYKVVYDFADGNKKEVVVGKAAKADKSNEENIGQWQICGSSENDNPPVYASYDYDIAGNPSWKPSVRVFSNQSDSSATLQLNPTTLLDTSKTYRFSCKVLGNKIKKSKLYVGDEQGEIAFLGNQEFNYTDAWETKTADIQPKGNEFGIRFTIENPTEDMWLHDLSLYVLDGGKTVGENLLANFDSAESLARPNDINVSVEKNYDSGAKLAWEPDNDSAVAIYEKDGDKLNLRAYVPASLGSVNIGGLENDKDIELVARTIKNGVPSEGVSVTAHPIPAVVFGEYQVADDNGQKKVSVTVKNNEMGDDYTAQLILAVYDGNMVLRMMGTDMAANIPQTDPTAEPVTLEQSIAVGSGETLRAYLWNSISGMTPLKPVETLIPAQ